MVTRQPTFGTRQLPRMPAQQPFDIGDHPVAQLFDQYRQMGRASIAEPFTGITTDGRVVRNLYTIQSTDTVVRTPNGNDDGRDLLRQHLVRDHGPAAVPARGVDA
jgi:hypothetical protein